MSMNKKHGLGRGLEALLGEDDLTFTLDDIKTESITDKGIKTVSIDSLIPSPYQPRKSFDEEALKALVASIKEKGVLQPLLVRKKENKYEIIAGERRWRASKLAGIKEVPVIEKSFDDQETLEVALIENLLRENLSAVEEAEGFNRLITEFSHTHEALSQIVGKSRSYITNTLRLLSLPLTVQEMIKNNTLSAGHARALVGMENAEDLAQKIVAKNLTVRQTEELVNKIKNHELNKINKAIKKDPSIKETEKNISKALGLRVRINKKEDSTGKVVISYKNQTELKTILEKLERKA